MTSGKPDASIVTLHPDTIAALEDIDRRGLTTNSFIVCDPRKAKLQVIVYDKGTANFISPESDSMTVLSNLPDGRAIEICSLKPSRGPGE